MIEPRRAKPARARATRAKIFLAGDIGGTKTNLALFELRGTRLARVDGERFPSGEHAGLEEILDLFLKPRRVRLLGAAFGIAGPVVGGRSETTNLPWIVDSRRLARRLQAPAALVNDLEATAHAIPGLSASMLAVLNAGRPAKHGNLALVAAGTGLGEAYVLRRDGGFIVGATEGGHCDFAARTDQEIALLKTLIARYGHVSVERVLSGPGLVNIYEFLQEQDRVDRTNLAGTTVGRGPTAERAPQAPLRRGQPGERRPSSDRNGASTLGEGSISAAPPSSGAISAAAISSAVISSAVISPLAISPGAISSAAISGAISPSAVSAATISAAALDGSSALAARALRLFASLYGAEAGNLALKVLARGGVYLGGGIAPKILPFLKEGDFLEGFLYKGRFRDFLASIPVRVILDDQAALLGAALVASRLAGG